jgi:hypothetical protein
MPTPEPTPAPEPAPVPEPTPEPAPVPPPKPLPKPDLAAQSVWGQTTATGYLLKGKIHSFGPGLYTGGRSYRFEKRLVFFWVPLTPMTPLAGPLAAGGSRIVQATLGAAPKAGTQVRLHLTPGDGNVGNDNSAPFAVVLPDLKAQNLTAVQTPAGVKLAGQVRNNGPGIYAGGRSYRFEKWKNGGWVPLGAFQPLTGPLAAGGVKVVTKTVPGTLPNGKLVRLHVTPGDAVPANDVTTATFHAPDLRAVSAWKVGGLFKGTIHNNGPGTYLSGRNFRFEKKVGMGPWLPVSAASPIPGGPLAPGGNRTVSAPVLGVLSPGTQIRLHISPGDANVGNDHSPPFIVP